MLTFVGWRQVVIQAHSGKKNLKIYKLRVQLKKLGSE